MALNILLTGRPGIGKTTAIQRILERMDPSEYGGFWSSEIRERGTRVGFRIQTTGGRMGVLAHVASAEGPRVGKYRVNISDINSIAVPAMREAREKGLRVIVDEIAKMELYSTQFQEETLRCLDDVCVLGTIQQRSEPFMDSILSRPDVEVVEITRSNRHGISNRVLAMLDE